MYETELEKRCIELQEKLTKLYRWKPTWKENKNVFEFTETYVYTNGAVDFGFIESNPRRVGGDVLPCYFLTINDKCGASRMNSHFTDLELAKNYLEQLVENQLATY